MNRAVTATSSAVARRRAAARRRARCSTDSRSSPETGAAMFRAVTGDSVEEVVTGTPHGTWAHSEAEITGAVTTHSVAQPVRDYCLERSALGGRPEVDHERRLSEPGDVRRLEAGRALPQHE